ncbi:hypothetical protein MGYG_09162 [Nannizzia gypsea CBS 118893]|uniref:Cell morphogenesis protein Las1 n=1 Tax=Arthroderma gypseum (strain ATCC MYA-4604 / CBS 118893) TaxID=535722 RepID=E4V3R7_ARTGP|nr:hypothetical protein MGYG_09162 [Nannizzia gypsea CBS 118893]EFR04641.1 hypothetical protein MGYG_09162 [Nannizzia gypsea CBS 118893]
MERPKITPWKELSQLVSVREQFYRKSDDGEDCRAKACSLVWVWKLRGNLPHAVEATALLTDAILHDDPEKNSIFSIRAAYSLAFCRFVTGLVDSKLHGPKQSMYQKAMAVGVPASFVELRHEATHRDLPSLVVLRDAARRSMDWLWEFYWNKIDNGSRCICEPAKDSGISESEKSDIVLGTVTSMLHPLIEHIYTTTKGGRPRNRARQQSGVKLDIIRDISTLCCREKIAGDLLVQILLDQDCGYLTSCAHGNSYNEKDKETQSPFSAWDDVLREFSRSYQPFLTLLVEGIATILVSADSRSFRNVENRDALDGKKYEEDLFLWLDHILSGAVWEPLRNQYLVLSHVRAICRVPGLSAGFWAEEIDKILPDEYTAPTRVSDTPGGGKADSSKLPAAPDAAIDPNSDIAVLRNYGWDFGQKISCRPIGSIDPS